MSNETTIAAVRPLADKSRVFVEYKVGRCLLGQSIPVRYDPKVGDPATHKGNGDLSTLRGEVVRKR
jgi:hypothetical protein